MATLTTFLNSHKVGKGKPYTHTSIKTKDHYNGSYFISKDNEDEFYNLYLEAINDNKEIWLTERHLHDKSPIVIDIDIKVNKLERNENYVSIIKDFIEFDIKEYIETYIEETHNYLKYYLLLRPEPYKVEKSSSNIYYKEGCHIIFPNVITDYNFQFLMRIKLMSKLKDRLIDIKDDLLDFNIEDIYDEAVIKRNNWSLLGSTKPGVKGYEIINDSNNDDDYSNLTIDLLKDCSVRTDKQISNIIESKNKELLDEYTIHFSNKKSENKKVENIKVNIKNEDDYKNEEIEDLLELLSENWYEEHSKWFKIGCILYNDNPNNFSLWTNWSKKSSKYDNNDNKTYMKKLWDYTYPNYTKDKLTIGSLYYEAEKENEVGYKAFIKKYKKKNIKIKEAIEKGVSGYDNDLAFVLFQLTQDKFKYCNKNLWVFEYPIWICLGDEYIMLSQNITNLMIPEYEKLTEEYRLKHHYFSSKDDINEKDCEKYKKLYERSLTKIIPFLKDNGKKHKIIKEAKDYFLDNKFEKNLDSNLYLLCFNNGVYDLKTDSFRKAKSEDYMTLSTDFDYKEEVDYTIMHQITSFIQQILPNKAIMDYVLTLLASCLDGTVNMEKFYIFTGGGGNGKSKLIELFESVMGYYNCKLPISLLTQKRNGAECASPELMKSQGKRFACLQEPDKDDKINVSFMKELTGGDKISGRQLYKNPIEFKPQFTMVLCCNYLPKITSDDGGTWRRIKVVEFQSRFVDKPNPDHHNEFKIDYELSIKMKEWKQEFMILLLAYYKVYKNEGIKEPEEVQIYTKKYKQTQNKIELFVDECIKKGEDTDFITAKEIKSTFEMWWLNNKEDYEKKNNISRDELLKKVEGILGTKIIERYQPYINGKQLNLSSVFIGFRIIYINDENLMDDDSDNLL
jgi:P4 family phage/plasmid primase-like protien